MAQGTQEYFIGKMSISNLCLYITVLLLCTIIRQAESRRLNKRSIEFSNKGLEMLRTKRSYSDRMIFPDESERRRKENFVLKKNSAPVMLTDRMAFVGRGANCAAGKVRLGPICI